MALSALNTLELESLKGMKVCILDKDNAAYEDHSEWLRECEAEVIFAKDIEELTAIWASENTKWSTGAFDLLITEAELENGTFEEAIGTWKKKWSSSPILVSTSHPSIELVVNCMRKGIFDFMRKPVPLDEFKHALVRAAGQRLMLKDNETLSTAFRVMNKAQSLVECPSQHHMLRAFARMLHQELESEATYLWVFHAQRQSVERMLELRGTSDPIGYEKQALQVLQSLLPAKNSPLPRLDEMDIHTEPPSPLFVSPKPGLVAVVLNSLTGNSAYLVHIFDPEIRPSLSLEPYKPLVQQASRIFHHFDVSATVTFLDDLTGLYNKRYLDVALKHEMTRVNRYGGTIALMFLDLDNFKEVNDAHGHLTGSHVLREVSALLRKMVRESDVLTRYGGDEFVIMLPNTNEQQAVMVAERICVALRKTSFEIKDSHSVEYASELDMRIELSMSIGIAEYPACATHLEHLLEVAYRAMYTAKNLGKNRVEMAPSLK